MIKSPPSFPRRRPLLGVNFDFIDYRQVLDRVLAWREAGRREIVTITNPHSVLLCGRDRAMGAATRQAALTLPDGVGIILAARILGYPNMGRVTGPTLMLKLADWGRAASLRHYFFGGREGIADKLAERMVSWYPGMQVAGTFCPPFKPLTPEEDRRQIDAVNAARPDIVWVGLGAPKQEKWMLAHRGIIAAPAMIGVGAAFDFHAGVVPWAPRWIRHCGLEWAWRLVCEPRRMWRRNLDSPKFLLKVVRQKFFSPPEWEFQE